MILLNTYFSQKDYYNNRYKLNNSPSFGYRLPKHPVDDIRDVSHLCCGCCGHDTLRASDILNILSTFIAGSKRALENSVLNPFRNTEAFSFIKELSVNAPKKPISKIISTPEASGKIEQLPENVQLDISKIALLSDKVTIKAPAVMKRFEKYFEMFNAYNKEILGTLQIYSQKYPKKTFAEILKMPEIVEYHTKMYDANKNAEMKQKIAVFKSLKDLYPKMTPAEIKVIQSINSNVLTVLNNAYYQPHIKKILVNHIYSEYFSVLDNKNLANEINNIVSRLPYGENNAAHKFIIDFNKSDNTDMDLVEYFLRELQATFEHIVAKSKNGSDSKSNGIMLCKQCNNERSDIDYELFLEAHPEMPKNLQRQMNKAMTFVKHGKLLGYDDYFVDVKPVLLNASGNLLKIRIRSLLKYREMQAISAYQKAEKSYLDCIEDYNDAANRMIETDRKIDELMKEIKALKKEKRIATERFVQASETREYNKSKLDSTKKTLEKSESVLESDMELNINSKVSRKRNK